MMEQQCHLIEVSCLSCSDGQKGDLSEVRSFSKTHYRETGHNVSWSLGNAEMFTPEDVMSSWQVACSKCRTQWTFATKDDVDDFISEHASDPRHGHECLDVEVVQADLDPDDVLTVVNRLEEHPETNGAQIVHVVQILQEDNLVFDVINAIERLVNSGKLYRVGQKLRVA